MSIMPHTLRSLPHFASFSTALIAGVLSTPAQAQLGPRVLPPEQQNTGPTLEETTQWITRKVDEMPGRASPTRIGAGYYVAFRHCDMFIVKIDFQNVGKIQILDNVFVPKQVITQDKISLQNVDIDKISASKAYASDKGSLQIYSPEEYISQIEIYGPADGSRGVEDYRKLSLETLEDKVSNMERKGMNGRTMSDLWRWGELVSRYTRKYTGFETADLDSAYHLVDAFKHAATLCQREKAESLKMKPKKPGELF